MKFFLIFLLVLLSISSIQSQESHGMIGNRRHFPDSLSGKPSDDVYTRKCARNSDCASIEMCIVDCCEIRITM
ncbi:hypothetical protein L3Y34_017000 [Caenorhabditis briggsae]|uniref:Uncharacterized protein n=1 Tax=Caenorhabditis briggsae TaxID=6238 RepID=A0AAE9DGB3_CAEBR|nr:hypothetical protein L3Y34_017000 [Caenorhabditis briggsae]